MRHQLNYLDGRFQCWNWTGGERGVWKEPHDSWWKEKDGVPFIVFLGCCCVCVTLHTDNKLQRGSTTCTYAWTRKVAFHDARWQSQFDVQVERLCPHPVFVFSAEEFQCDVRLCLQILAWKKSKENKRDESVEPVKKHNAQRLCQKIVKIK